MTNVIQMEDHKSVWEWGIAWCWKCRTEWNPVVHMDADKSKLECPVCHAMDSKYLNGAETHAELEEAIEAAKIELLIGH